MNKEILEVLSELERDKGIPRDVLMEAMKAAIVSASKRQYKLGDNVDAEFDSVTGEIKLQARKEVVSEIEDPELQILLEDAILQKKDISLGDYLIIDLQVEGLGRIAASTAKQVISQRLRDAERSKIYGEFIGRVGELITGSVSQIDKGNIYVDIGRTEAILPRREQIYKEVYKRNDRVRCYILEVREFTKGPQGPQVVLSRTHPGLVVRLFEMEVPEIYDGIVEVKECVREPSGRSKIAVTSRDRDVDAVGACVGPRGIRVQNIVQELRGERIDIVLWNEDIRTYAENALNPAKIQHIDLFEEEKRMEILVPDDQLSVAIGKSGQNVRLASRLLGWKIDMKAEGEYRRLIAEQTFSGDKSAKKDKKDANESDAVDNELLKLEVVGDKMAELLMNNGFNDIESIASTTPEALCEVPGIGPTRANLLIESAKEFQKTDSE